MGCGASSESASKAPKGFAKIKEVEIEETGITEGIDGIFKSYGEIQSGLASMNNAIVDAHDKLVEAINEIVEKKGDTATADELKENPRKYVHVALKYLKDAGCELKLNGFSIEWSSSAEDTLKDIIGAIEELVEAVKECVEKVPEVGKSVADLVSSITSVDMGEVMEGIKGKASNPMQIPKLLKQFKKNMCAVKDGPKTLTGVKDTAFAIKNSLTGS